MSKTNVVMKAGTAASLYLEMRGFKIMERNWQRPRSKIDIIAIKDNVINFVEVKFYSQDYQSSSVEALTSSQLLHMQRSAWAWVDETKWKDKYVISSVEIAGPDYVVLSFTENII
jgi:putative endonuclease